MKAAAILACLLGSAGSVLGWSSSSQRCEVCNTQTSYISDYSNHYRTVTIPQFNSQSGNWEMYLRVSLTHTFLGDLTMTLRQNSGSTMSVWNRECGSLNDLGAIFYDSATRTVSSQGKCSYSRSSIVYARPYQYFSTRSIGNTATGSYYFTLRDNAGADRGYLYSVCIGFFDSVGCSFTAPTTTTTTTTTFPPQLLPANTSMCELCTAEEIRFRKGETVAHTFQVSDFESLSNETDFFVAVDVDHDYLGSLEMKLKDEDSGNEVYLWNNECGSSNDLNVSFSDAFNGTVAEQLRCDYPGNLPINAEPNQLMGSIGASEQGSYTFTLKENGDRTGGTINQVCVGWFDEEGCSLNGSITLEHTRNLDSDSPRCEICDNRRTFFQRGSSLDRLFTVTDFESQSGANQFFVSVNIEHNYLGSLEMLIEDLEGENQVYLWNNECGSADDLNVTFSDIFNGTVSRQGGCYEGSNATVFADPYQSLSNIGTNGTGEYRFTLWETYNYYSGYLKSVCVGWYDREGCSLSGTVSSIEEQPRCEICDNEEALLSADGTLLRQLTVTDFESDSGESDFYVSVQMDHNYLGSLEMLLENEDTGVERYLWNNECGSSDDLNVTFSDRFTRTVSNQNRCGSSQWSRLYAKPYQSLGNIAANGTGTYLFTLKDTYGYSGYLNRVCFGWFDSNGCSFTGGIIEPLSSSSPRCEICNNWRSPLPSLGQITRRFTVTDFESISNVSAFYVSLQIDYDYLGYLRMTLEDENSEEQVYLWNQECSYFDDVNVVMSDIFDGTVSEQSRCGSSIDSLVYARPYQSFANLSTIETGNYTFNVESLSSSYSGYLNRVCIGWFAQDGCNVTGTVSNDRCEICDNTRRYFRRPSRIDRLFTITDFESDSNDLDFYVSVKLDHNYLAYVEMTLTNETDTSVKLWDNECSSADDLNVTFSDRYTYTVASQGRCWSNIQTQLFARPYQSLGSIAANKLGQYTFSLYETGTYGGYLENVCIGWYAANGCSVSGSVSAVSERPSCEICDNTRTYFPSSGTLSRRFTINDFNSESGNSDFYVKVAVDHIYLGSLEMTLEDETNSVTRYLWNNECGSADDLNVTFSDDYDSTVYSQGACSYGLYTPVYARGWQSFGSIGETQTGRYEFTLKETYNYYSGYLNRVCVGWYDHTGCTVSGSVAASGIYSSSPRCEICDYTWTYFPRLGTYRRKFTVTSFESDSGESEFSVRVCDTIREYRVKISGMWLIANKQFIQVRLDHNYLGSLDMTLRDDDSGITRYLWNNECSYYDDLYVTFSDAFTSTVAGQSRCSWSHYSQIYARPYNYFGSVGDSQTGEYTFELQETGNWYSGYVYSVCVGWFDEQGCRVNGTVESVDDSEEETTTDEPISEKHRCEICNNQRRYFSGYGSMTTTFDVTDFSSESNDPEFYVSAQVDHNYLGSLDMKIQDVDAGITRYLWNNECSYYNDLNVTFSDAFDQTVSSQNRCGYGRWSPVYAKPYQSLGSIGGNQTGEYIFTLQDNYGYAGYIDRVCIGWFDEEGCSINSGSLGSNSPRCEICDSERTYFPAGGSYSRSVDISNFASQSGENAMYVAIEVDHDYLGSLDMKLEKDGYGNKIDLWDNECGTSNDLNAVFSDIFDETVDDQSKCDEGLSTRVYAAPHEEFGSIGDTQTGTYTFTLKERSNFREGYVNSVCLGWFDLEGCSLNAEAGSPEAPQRCEICDSGRRYFAPNDYLSTIFDVNSFQSDSGRHSFFVSVNLEHSNLGSLYLTVWDEMDEYTAYGNSFLYQDCEGYSNLNATFSNIFEQTIEEQGGCSAGLNTEVFARPKYRFGRYVGNQTEGGFEVEIYVDGDTDGGGYLNEVCIGWYTSSKDDNCQMTASVTSGSGSNRRNRNNDGDDVATIVGSVVGSVFGCLLCVALCYYLYNLKAKSDFERRRMLNASHAAVASLDSADIAADEVGATSNGATVIGASANDDFMGTEGTSADPHQGVQLAHIAFEGGGDITAAEVSAAAPAYSDGMAAGLDGDAPPIYTDAMAGEFATDAPAETDAPPSYGEW